MKSPMHGLSVSSLVLVALLAAQALAATAVPATPAANGKAAGQPGIAWHQGDVAGAFAEARRVNKPVFLYWGAVWCPPCNQVKATIFNRQSFIQLTRQFIPVYLDGDTPDGQKTAEQYKVRGYPTMILFKPDGSEVTRLPGEVDYDRYLNILQRGLLATRPIKQLLGAALEGRKLTRDEWAMLADYAWETDQTQLVAEGQVAATLYRLAARIPSSEASAATRLSLRAMAIDSVAASPAAFDQARAREVLTQVLSLEASRRANFDVLVNYTESLAKAMTAGEAKIPLRLGELWSRGLRGLAADTSLSMNDRLNARLAELQLARRLESASPIRAELVKSAREMVEQADKATTDRYERQSVINTAAQVLAEAGLATDADEMLRAELKRSPAPYYFMLALAANAKRRGDAASAVTWYEKAFDSAEGPATRLQWGASYLGGLVDLLPKDEARLEAVAVRIAGDIEKTPNAFYERNRRTVARIVQHLQRWNRDKEHAAAMQRIGQRYRAVCASLPKADPQSVVCEEAVAGLRN